MQTLLSWSQSKSTMRWLGHPFQRLGTYFLRRVHNIILKFPENRSCIQINIYVKKISIFEARESKRVDKCEMKIIRSGVSLSRNHRSWQQRVEGRTPPEGEISWSPSPLPLKGAHAGGCQWSVMGECFWWFFSGPRHWSLSNDARSR